MKFQKGETMQKEIKDENGAMPFKVQVIMLILIGLIGMGIVYIAQLQKEISYPKQSTFNQK